MTISGEAGVGKSCVAVFALNYLAERHYFSDGVLYVEASSCDSAELRPSPVLWSAARALRSRSAR